MPSPETDRARYLRNNMTETERRVWSRLRSRQLGGFKFRRQVPVGPYFIDFLCISERLAIEVDGPLHEEESDQRKNEWLGAAGFRVIRIPVSEVDESLDDVIHGIYLELSEPSLPPRVSPPGVARCAGEADLPAERGGECDPDPAELSEPSLPPRVSPPGVARFAGEADLPAERGGERRTT